MKPDQLFKCLSDKSRLTAALLIHEAEEACVCDVMVALELDQPTTSRHLANLRKAGVLSDERRGKWVYYRLQPSLPDWVVTLLTVTSGNNREYFSAALSRLHTSRQLTQRCC